MMKVDKRKYIRDEQPVDWDYWKEDPYQRYADGVRKGLAKIRRGGLKKVDNPPSGRRLR